MVSKLLQGLKQPNPVISGYLTTQTRRVDTRCLASLKFIVNTLKEKHIANQKNHF